MIYLFRHGKTVLNAQQRYQGGVDIGLSDEGVSQFKALATDFKSDLVSPKAISTIYCSPLRRARQSAELLQAVLGGHCKVEIRLELKEMSFGEFEGIEKSSIRQLYPDYYPQDWQNPYISMEVAFPQGESLSDVYQRIAGFCTEIEEDVSSNIVVGHGGVNKMLLARMLKLDAQAREKYVTFTQDYQDIIEINRQQGRASYRVIN
ncbi:histidine phosphatase family protein [Alteromonas stellipolaris]|uniref:histidine phosphatase family protein n=1 Tax=Alteromonas stellipolaris TaxID=233316 RepID=UPI001DBA439E|nr:histidine phosphatase family protein [Alteromonas stellipolaris]MBZ2163255.1 histidine phosphatase family protein [Alteromonas stellipolaris]